MATSAPESEAGVLVVRRRHLLVRCSHWLNAPILLGLILSGMSRRLKPGWIYYRRLRPRNVSMYSPISSA
jgi:hypothetical protein